jgi:hypothetical protein
MGEAAIKNLPAEDIFQANPLPAAFFCVKELRCGFEKQNYFKLCYFLEIRSF